MKIIKITKVKNNAKISFENGDKLFLRYEIFVKNALRKGDEVSDELISSLNYQNEFFLAKETAFRIITRRIHSAKELERKLLQRKLDQKIVAEVVADLVENKYVDDETFAKAFIDERRTRKFAGVNKLKNDLRAKGVSREIIENFVEEDFESEFENAIKIGEKKLNSLQNKFSDKRELKQKLSSYLMLKGFNFDVIKQAAEKLINSED